MIQSTKIKKEKSLMTEAFTSFPRKTEDRFYLEKLD